MTDKPKAEVAPLTLRCKACGVSFQVPAGRSGAKRAYCDLHARSKSIHRAEFAYQQRKNLGAEMAAQGAAAREVGKVLRLAAGLRVFTDPELAAKIAGVTERGDELAALVVRARRELADVVAGDMRGTAHVAESVAHILLVEVLERRAEIPAKDLAQFARFALQARQEFIGEGVQSNYIAINIGVVPPPADGKLTPEQRAKVQGRAEAQADASRSG